MRAQKARATLPAIAKRYSDEEVIKVINQYYGNKSLIVAALQSTAQQFEVWLRKDGHKQALEEARQRILDKCEEKMMKLLDSDNEKVVFDTAKFILQNLGRSRGYHGDSPAIAMAIEKSGDDIKVAVQGIFGI